MSRRANPPKYARHSSGQARVRINGKSVYLGAYGSQESRDRYGELVAEWLVKNAEAGVTCPSLSIGKLCIAFLDHSKRHSRKNGREASEVNVIRQSLKRLCRLYANETARSFGPAKLKAVRQSLIESGNARTTINAQIGKIRRMFRWSVSEELAAR